VPSRSGSDEHAQATAAKVGSTQCRLEAEIAKLVSGKDCLRGMVLDQMAGSPRTSPSVRHG
jgi:hypothetical protein